MRCPIFLPAHAPEGTRTIPAANPLPRPNPGWMTAGEPSRGPKSIGGPCNAKTLTRRSRIGTFTGENWLPVSIAVVRERGVEPPRPNGHWHLKPARLPFRHSRIAAPHRGSLMSLARAHPERQNRFQGD